MRRRSDVRSADLNFIRRPARVPADEFYPLQWHLAAIGLAEAWDLVAADSGVVVAVVDTGVVAEHPDLAGRLVAGYDFIQNPSVAADGDGCDADPDDPGDGAEPGTSSYHGTHVAGTVAARTSLGAAGDATGVAGVAWNARVMPLRVLGRGGGSDYDVMQAMRYAAGLDNACGALPARRADVINLSLGGPGRSEAFAAVIQEVRAAGVAIVAAAGNQGSDAPVYPAAYEGLISVSAVDSDDVLTAYSSFGATIDVAAPGGDVSRDADGDGYADGVLSLFVDDTGAQDAYLYLFSAGTSMAAPHVSGVLALMLGENGDLTPDDLDALLAAGHLTADLGNPAWYGAGRIDAAAAVRTARAARSGALPERARLVVDPVLLRFGGAAGAASEADLTLSSAGDPGGALVVGSAVARTDDGLPWLDVVPASVGGSGLGRYRVSVDREAARGAGVYRGAIVFRSNRNDLEVPVSFQVEAVAGPMADAGRHYVLLLDPASGESLRSLAALAEGGVYEYAFDALPAGDYEIVGGSDRDNDGSICDAGEACGAYPSLDAIWPLRIDRDRSGLDFETGL